jgi:hypothetical protein
MGCCMLHMGQLLWPSALGSFEMWPRVDRYRDSSMASNVCFDKLGVKFTQGSGRERETESRRVTGPLSLLLEGYAGVGKKEPGLSATSVMLFAS